MNREKPVNVFLSHAGADADDARHVLSALSGIGRLRVFSINSLSAGENWKTKLRSELQQCDVFLLLLSSRTVLSPWMLQELGAAWVLKKPILAITDDPSLLAQLPLDLQNAPVIPLSETSNSELFERRISQLDVVAA